MKIDQSKFSNWIKSKEHYLPGISELIKISGSKTLVVGASVFELYHLQDWTPPQKRQTSDFDLSIGLVGNDQFYERAKNILLNIGYKIDSTHPYRFHPSKKILGGLQYIDLLAHPLDSQTENSVALNAMGVSDNFSLSGFKFATINSYALEDNMIFPNIFGMILLKIEAYLDEPTKRTKDFADILELISGLVDKGQHFELSEEFSKIKDTPEANKIKRCLKEMAKENATTWDIENIRPELNKRLFNDNFIDTTLVQQIKAFLLQLE